MRGTAWCCAALLLAAGGVATVDARVYLTQKEALATAFPDPQQVERRTLYLTDAQAERVKSEAGVPVERRVVPYYVGRIEDRISGYAYFDTHLVRTLPETILVRLAADGRITAIEIVSFDEPEDYLPNSRWLRQFADRDLDAKLSLKGSIRVLSGATLSSRAITGAARRVLALHKLFVAGHDGTPDRPAERDAP